MAPGLRGNCDLPQDELKLCRYAHHLPSYPSPLLTPTPSQSLNLFSIIYGCATEQPRCEQREMETEERSQLFQDGRSLLLKASQSHCVISRFILFFRVFSLFFCDFALNMNIFFFLKPSNLKFTLPFQTRQQGCLYAVLSSLITDILLRL